MSKIRFSLLALGLIASSGVTQAQTAAPTGTAATPRPATTTVQGACIIFHANGQTSCSIGMDAGGCNAVAMESRSKTSFKPGEACP